MKTTLLLAGVAMCALADPAMAQTTPPAPPAADNSSQGVLVFEPSFFAASRPDTALEMISRLPGFALDTGDSDTRGFAGAAGNVLIDGQRPSTKSDSLDSILRRISASGVARVELIRGGAPGIDMQGRSVVANVVLVRTVTLERVLETNAYFYPDGYIGPVLLGRFSRRDGDSQIEGSISATSDRTDGTATGFRRRFTPDGALVQDADLVLWDRIRNVRATGTVQRRTGGGLLRVNGVLEWETIENSQDVLVRAGPGPNTFSDEDSREIEGEVGVNWTRDLGPRTGIEITGLQRYSSEDYTSLSEGAGDNSIYAYEASSGESIGRAVLRYRPGDQWAVESGGELAWNFLDISTRFEENGVPIPLPGASVRVEELRGEVFGQSTWRPDPKFSLELGLRVEVSEISQSGDSNLRKSFVYPKPRIQATWTPLPGRQFRIRIEREVGQLDFEDFAASADIDVGQVEGGNPDLEPYKAIVLEGVYEHRFWDEGVLDFTFSHSELTDVVDIIPLAGGFDAVGNIGDGTQDIFQTRLTLPTSRLGVPNGRLQLRGTWSQSSVTDPVTGEERRLRNEQPFGCSVSFNQDVKGGRWSWGFDHGCNTDRNPVYRTREIRTNFAEPGASVYALWKPRADLTLRVNVGNATDRAIGYDRDIYAGPRDTAPLSIRETRRTQMSPWLFVQVRKTL